MDFADVRQPGAPVTVAGLSRGCSACQNAERDGRGDGEFRDHIGKLFSARNGAMNGGEYCGVVIAVSRAGLPQESHRRR